MMRYPQDPLSHTARSCISLHSRTRAPQVFNTSIKTMLMHLFTLGVLALASALPNEKRGTSSATTNACQR